jgi:hypothetical protein
MTGSSVNSQAQAAEQQNQNTAQQYAAQQQAAALAGLNQYIKSNPSPASTAKPITGPSFAAPKTMGGGVASGGNPGAAPNMAMAQGMPVNGPGPGGAMPTQGGAMPAQGSANTNAQSVSPQMQALIAQLMQAQSPPKPAG